MPPHGPTASADRALGAGSTERSRAPTVPDAVCDGSRFRMVKRMTPPPRLPRRAVLGSALGLVALTSCTGEDEPEPAEQDGPAGSDGGGSAAPDPSTAVTTTTLPWGRATVTVGVRPLVRHDGHLVLTLDLQAEDPEGDVTEDLVQHLAWVWGASRVGTWHAVRLLDLGGDTVAGPALDAGGNAVVNTTDTDWHDGTTLLEGSVQLVYADPGLDAVDLLFPKAPLVTAVPVLDAEVPALDPDENPLDLAAVDHSPVSEITALSADLLAPIREETEAESVTVSIGSDVLFDSSSAELSPEAEQVLDDAVQRIQEHEPGPVTVIGHTDDVDDDAFNLDLSQRRAEAVAQALTPLIDTTDHPLETEGKGEAEPIADNSTSEGRAENRRVELLITAPLSEETTSDEEAEPPPFDGITGTGEEGVLLEDHGTRPVRLRAVGARFVSEHLVVTLEAVIEDEDVDSVQGLGGFNTMLTYRRDIERTHTHVGIGVLNGSTMTMPALHHRGGPDDALVPLTDLYTPSRIDGGVPRVIELVYPRDIDGVAPGGTLTLQHGRNHFRLTDIAIAD